MKKHLLPMLLLALLCGLAVGVSVYWLVKKDGETGEVQEAALSQADSTLQNLAQSLEDDAARKQSEKLERESEAAAAESEAAVFTNEHHQVIFVGDSRTIGMGRAEAGSGDTCIYIGEAGEGLSWFVSKGMPRMETAIEEHPYAPVVFNFGVNDADEIQNYLVLYRELEEKYPDTSFYYMSVNPVTEESVTVPNSDVVLFNEQLRAAFPAQYIDTYSNMQRNGFESVDGVHYSESQYRKIHDMAVSAIVAYRGAESGAESRAESGAEAQGGSGET